MEHEQRELAELRRKRDTLEKARADLDASIRALVESGGGAVVAGDVNVQNGDFIGHDQINLVIGQAAAGILRRVRPHVSSQALQDAAASYLRYVLDRYRYLGLKGMGVSDRVPLRLPLLDLYVPLKARLEMPEGETWKRDLRLAGRALAEGGRLGEPQPVLDLLRQHDGLVILGDPGAGKTTFLKFIALHLALGRGAALGLESRLPVLLPLSAYANALAGRDALRLDDFIAAYLHELGSDMPIAEMLTQSLDRGAALILLDGLDEVQDPALRHTVVERVVDFYTLHRRSGNKFVLTSRIVGYRAVRPAAVEGLNECTLVDFESEEIEAFVSRWTAAVEKQAQGETAVAQADAGRERRELLASIHHNAGVRQLAANPLLLTILALMKRQGIALPERRVELYDQYVRTLLSSWNRARGLGRPAANDVDVVQTVRILAPLALWMHRENPGVGLVKREALRRRLETIYQERGAERPEEAARQFLSDVREHAGLLLERGPGEYGFIHLTFEEYLAAVAVALDGQGNSRPIVDFLARRVGDPAWREVSLLTVPYLGIIQQLDRVAGEVVETLVEEQPGDPGQAVVLAGEAVLDAGASGAPSRSRRRVVDALVEAMQDAAVAPRLRRQAGLLLGNLGWRPAGLDDFLPIEPGRFLYGDDKEKREIHHRYRIARYPVTNLQYARFVDEGGYRRREFWDQEGWAWREGEDGREQPAYWDDPERNNPIFPVVGVTRYEARAYCKWLTARLPQALSGYAARPPAEEEWERAARGVDGREYPWGDEFNPLYTNTSTGKSAGGTTAVCTYPQGVSQAGDWDMSGNVWEWTASRWGPDNDSPVLRGGSWLYTQRLARCAYRRRLIPDLYVDDVGFRVVVSLVFPS